MGVGSVLSAVMDDAREEYAGTIVINAPRAAFQIELLKLLGYLPAQPPFLES